MSNENPYRANATMELLGKQVPLKILTEEIKKQMCEITEARKCTTTFMTAIDMFMLGYIYGKRAERARRKVAPHKRFNSFKNEEVG